MIVTHTFHYITRTLLTLLRRVTHYCVVKTCFIIHYACMVRRKDFPGITDKGEDMFPIVTDIS